LYALHWYWFARGNFREGRRHADEALKRAQIVDPMIRARAQIAFGDIAVWQADWNAIRAPLEEAVATLRGTSDLSVLSVALTLLGTAYAFAEKDDYMAAKTLAEAKEMGRRHGRGLGLACYWSGVAAQLRGDWSVARAELEQCREIGEQRGVPPAIAHANTVLGFVALHEKKRDEAIDCFRRALEIHARVDDRWGLTQVIEGVGLLLLEDGEAEIGTRLLAAASAAWLNLGARPGRDAEFERQKDARIRRALGDDRLRIIFASGAAMPYEAMVALAREQLAKLAETPAASRLRVRALGPMEIERDGERIEGERRARELLLFLLTQHKGATKEQIGAALWPGVDASRVRNNFHVTLHRLRKMLGGPEWISIENETYRIDRKNVDFDVDAFVSEGRAAIRSGNAGHLARAAALYRGDFMENTSGEGWHEDVRDRLRELYGEVLASLARVGNDPIDALERLFALNPTNEENARNLMNALEKQGDRTRAQRVYRRLVGALQAIGETPGF
jgi:DNA-binding SARP family transcriptional activator